MVNSRWRVTGATTLLAIVVALLKLCNNTQWVGAWNETTRAIGNATLLGGLLCAVAAAIMSHRNWSRMPPRVGAPAKAALIARLELLPVLAAPAIMIVVVTTTAYAMTLAVSRPGIYYPMPLVPLLLGPLVATLFAHAIAKKLALFIAIPIVTIACFIVPVVFAATENPGLWLFSPINNGLLMPEFIANPEFFGRQAVLAALASATIVTLLVTQRSKLHKYAVGALIVLTAATGIEGVARQPQREYLATTVDRASECAEQDGIRVCVIRDNARLLPALLETAMDVAALLPPGLTPTRYSQPGIAGSHDEKVAPLGTLSASDLLAPVIDSAAAWQVCSSSDNTIQGRSMWLLGNITKDQTLLDFDVTKAAMPPGQPAATAWAHTQKVACP